MPTLMFTRSSFPNEACKTTMFMKFFENNEDSNVFKRTTLIIIKLLITTILLYYIFYKYININKLLVAFTHIQYWLFFVVLFILFVNRYLGAYQTSYYFKKVFNIELGINYVFKVQLISSFFSFVLPGELAGGIVSWYMISDKSGKKMDTAAVIIFLRILSIITMGFFTFIGLVFEEKLSDLGLRNYLLILTVLLLLMYIPFVSIKAATAMKHFSQKIVEAVPLRYWRNYFVNLNSKLWDSMMVCSNADHSLILYTISMSMMWYLLVIIFFYFLMIMADINLPFQVSVWIIGVITFIQYLPVSFAGLGVRDISIIYILGEFYQVNPENSMILSTFYLASSLIFVLMGGLAVWLKSANHIQTTR